MQFIASAGAIGDASLTVDTSSTLDIQAGDLLVAFVGGNGVTLSGVAEDDASNVFTVLGNTTAWNRCGCAYLLSAAASTGATIRATLSSVNGTESFFTVLQFRPDAGESVAFGDGPASADAGWDDNPTSGQLSTTEANSLWIGGAVHNQDMTNQLIGGDSPDGTVARDSGGYYLDVSYLEYSSAQSDVAYSTTGTWGAWGAQLMYFEITTSGAPAVNKGYIIVSRAMG